VCRGFVALYERRARESGLTAVPVSRYAKGFDYVHGRSSRRPNHAWLAVGIGGAWRLVDPTWGAGAVVDPTWGAGAVVDGRFEPRFSWDFFLVDPEILLLSHLPERAEWQVVERPLRRAEFARIPLVPRTLLDVGFTPDAIRALAEQSRLSDFPAVGVPTAAVRVLHAPISGAIRRSATVPVRMVWPNASDVALVTGGEWIALERAGDLFHGEAVAAGGALFVVGRMTRHSRIRRCWPIR
jgi:hypothetical protein